MSRNSVCFGYTHMIYLQMGRMYSLREVNFIQEMLDFSNPKNSVGLKPNAELRKDAKAPSYNIVQPAIMPRF